MCNIPLEVFGFIRTERLARGVIIGCLWAVSVCVRAELTADGERAGSEQQADECPGPLHVAAVSSRSPLAPPDSAGPHL